MSDSEIIELLRQKKPEAIDALLKKYGPLMKYIIEPILSDYREREECLSDVTYRIWDKIDTFQLSKGGFNTWISAITRNAAYNRAKANKLKSEMQEIPEDTKSNDRSPEEEILRRLLINCRRRKSSWFIVNISICSLQSRLQRS